MRKRPDDSASPDLTPMIDCVFQLIIFFMVGCKFKSLDGMLQTHLPKEMGHLNTICDELTPWRLELKVAGDYALVDGRKTPQYVQVILNGEDLGLYARPALGGNESEKVAFLEERRLMFDKVSRRLATLVMQDSSDRPTPMIIAPDLRVPTDEVIQAVDAAVQADALNITFAGKIGDLDKLYAEDGIER